MFVIKYDKGSMVRLVQSIGQYPPIYSTKRHYTKEEIDRSWDKVAIEVGEKESLCRERWLSIRSCYIRHLKYTALNSNRRPYYLAEYLGFMLPHVSEKLKRFISQKQFKRDHLPAYLKEALPREESKNTYYSQPVVQEPVIKNNYYSQPVVQEPVIKTEVPYLSQPVTEKEPVIKTEVLEIDEVSSESEWLSVSSDNQQPSSSNTAISQEPKKVDSVTVESTPKKVNTGHKSNSNADENFFKSLLPDIARMSDHQKLKFKQEALSIIEDILYAADDINITE